MLNTLETDFTPEKYASAPKYVEHTWMSQVYKKKLSLSLVQNSLSQKIKVEDNDDKH